MFDLFGHTIHFLTLYGSLLLTLITKTLQDWIESHLFFYHGRRDTFLYRRSTAAERTFCAFGLFIGVEGLPPFLHLILR